LIGPWTVCATLQGIAPLAGDAAVRIKPPSAQTQPSRERFTASDLYRYNVVANAGNPPLLIDNEFGDNQSMTIIAT
jgi:hypothetical protein